MTDDQFIALAEGLGWLVVLALIVVVVGFGIFRWSTGSWPWSMTKDLD